jgi:small-conductance mechanosensitive channel
MLLAVSVLGAAGPAVLLLHARRREDAPRPHHGLIRALTIVGILALAGSAVASLTGNVSLAEYLVSPPIRLLYLAIVIRLGVVVVTTTITVMALRTPFALSSPVIRERGAAVAATARRLIGLGGFGLWGYLALFNLGLLTWIQAGFLAFIRTEWQVGAAVIPVRDFIIFVLVLAASYGVSRILRLVLAEELFPRFHFPRGVPDALTLLAHYGVLLFGFLLALSSAGVDLSKVTIALSALGVGIGFGLQNVVNNFVCGLILVFEHPIQAGDYIEVGPHYGKVTRIGFRSSMVLTRDGSKVVARIPS